MSARPRRCSPGPPGRLVSPPGARPASDVDGIPPGLRGFTRFAAQTWVVEIEGGPLGADRRDRDEVVARGWARGGPLQRVAEAPGIVGGDPSAAPCGEPDVEQE